MESLREVRKICLVGVDCILANLVVAFRRTGFAGRVYAIEHAGSLKEAWECGVINDGSPETADGLRDAQLVLLSRAQGESKKRLETIVAQADPGAIVVDLSHMKGYIDRIFESTGRNDVHYVGLRLIDHPEMSGKLSRPEPFYFDNRSLILTPRCKDDLDAYALLSGALESIGAKVIALSPSAHDKLVAEYVHLPRIAALAVLQLVYSDHKGESLRPDILGRDLVGQLEELRDLYQTNWVDELEAIGKLVGSGVDRLIEKLHEIKADLHADQIRRRIEDLLDGASMTLEHIEETQIPQLVFVAEDKNKTLERVSGLLADARLTIGNLERALHPGAPAFKLTMKTSIDRDHAVKLLNSAGIEAYDI